MSSTKILLELARQVITPRFFIFSILFAIFFLCFSLVLLNTPNFISIATAPYDTSSKITIGAILFIGIFQSISSLDLMLLSIISILFGINLGLVIKKYNFLKKQANLSLTLGSGIISLAAAGCASCGLSIVSLVGLGSALAILPFGGLELYIVAIVILFASLIYNLKALYVACRI